MEQLYSQQNETVSPTYSEHDLPVRSDELEEGESASNTLTESTETIEMDSLALLLKNEANSQRREIRVSLACSAAFLSSMLWLALNTNMTESVLKSNLALWFTVMLGVSGGVCGVFIQRYFRRKKALTAALSKNLDKKRIGLLVRMLKAQDTSVSNLAKKQLTELFPSMTASDSALLDREERKILLRQLAIPPNDPGYRDPMELFSKAAYKRELEFRLAILKAFEQIGGLQEFEAVERVARGQFSALSASKFPDEVRKAAQECLPYLQARSEEQRDASQLLRASSVNDLSGEALLRPAASPSETGSELLLRASDPLN